LLILEEKGIKEKEKTSFFAMEKKSFGLKKVKKIAIFLLTYLLIIRAQCGILRKHFSKLFL